MLDSRVMEVQRIGRYEVLEHLASGGMGDVLLARSSGLAGFERHVVLKMLNVDDRFVAMFLEEARAVGRMHHQHIAPAYELDRDDDGRYFLVMDYVHGQTVKAVWQRSANLGSALPCDFTITVATAAASALHYAHTLRSRDGEPLEIVHRDISLSNLMIGYDGAVKLIDFGIAGRAKGTVAYMAPEQIEGRAIDRRTDIYALGVVLYELATMRRAFHEPTYTATLERNRRGAIVPPSRIVPGFSPELEAIILTALAVDPAARYQDADAMRRALEAFARNHKLDLGDAPVIELMERLFGQPEGAIPIAADDIATRPLAVPAAEIHDAPTAKLPDRSPQPVAAPSWSHIAVIPSHPRRSSWVAWLLPVSLVTIGIVVFELTTSPEREVRVPLAPIHPAAARPTPIVTPLPPPPEPAPTVRIHITTTPDDATVLLDGQRLGHTPYLGTVPLAPGTHVIKLRRRGCVPRLLDVDLTADVERDLVLQPQAP